MTQEQKPKQKVRLTGLWEKTLKDGTVLLWGYLGNNIIEVWPNKYRSEDKHPSHNIYIVENPKPREAKKSEEEFPF